MQQRNIALNEKSKEKSSTDHQIPVNDVSMKMTTKNDDSHIVVKKACLASATYALDRAQPLKPESFPNPPRTGSNPPCTVPNLMHLLKEYGIRVQYDVIRKKLQIILPDHAGTFENADQVSLTQINSLAALNGLSGGLIPAYVHLIGDRNPYNPVANWIRSKPWDGCDRLQNIFDTLTEREGYPRALKEKLMKRWLLSAVAAALKGHDFHSRGVLTLQGPQSIGKTSWINALVPDAMLRASVIKLDHHLDASNKDSVITAASHWIVEIGELDSSFKKDIARLKGFITATHDKIRRPYDRADSEYPRKTVFCASVNDNNFLVDETGNSRWWTIPVTKIKFDHGIDMQQIFAQVAILFEQGEQWWLTSKEESDLEEQNKNHRILNVVHESLLECIDINRAGDSNLPHMTAKQVLIAIGFPNLTNPNFKKCASFLRTYFGDSTKIDGFDGWRIPLKNKPLEFAVKNSSVICGSTIRNEDDF